MKNASKQQNKRYLIVFYHNSQRHDDNPEFDHMYVECNTEELSELIDELLNKDFAVLINREQ